MGREYLDLRFSLQMELTGRLTFVSVMYTMKGLILIKAFWAWQRTLFLSYYTF